MSEDDFNLMSLSLDDMFVSLFRYGDSGRVGSISLAPDPSSSALWLVLSFRICSVRLRISSLVL